MGMKLQAYGTYQLKFQTDGRRTEPDEAEPLDSVVNTKLTTIPIYGGMTRERDIQNILDLLMTYNGIIVP